LPTGKIGFLQIKSAEIKYIKIIIFNSIPHFKGSRNKNGQFGQAVELNYKTREKKSYIFCKHSIIKSKIGKAALLKKSNLYIKM